MAKKATPKTTNTAPRKGQSFKTLAHAKLAALEAGAANSEEGKRILKAFKEKHKIK